MRGIRRWCSGRKRPSRRPARCSALRCRPSSRRSCRRAPRRVRRGLLPARCSVGSWGLRPRPVARRIDGELPERAELPPDELRLAADGHREDAEVVTVEKQVRLQPEQLARRVDQIEAAAPGANRVREAAPPACRRRSRRRSRAREAFRDAGAGRQSAICAAFGDQVARSVELQAEAACRQAGENTAAALSRSGDNRQRRQDDRENALGCSQESGQRGSSTRQGIPQLCRMQTRRSALPHRAVRRAEGHRRLRERRPLCRRRPQASPSAQPS